MEKAKKRIIAVFTILSPLVAVIALVIAIFIDNSHKVKFEDETMAEMIVKTAGVESVDKFREDDLEKVEELNIGYVGYYKTIIDIEKCPNLDILIIGYPEYMYCRYEAEGKEVPKVESAEKIRQVEFELGEILKKCPNIKTLCISNESGDFALNSLEFLENGKKLEVLRLEKESQINDYSNISACVQLKHLSLYGSNISEISMIKELEKLEGLNLAETDVSEAKDILKLKKLEDLAIDSTPLVTNQKELELIYQQFPSINFY